MHHAFATVVRQLTQAMSLVGHTAGIWTFCPSFHNQRRNPGSSGVGRWYGGHPRGFSRVGPKKPNALPTYLGHHPSSSTNTKAISDKAPNNKLLIDNQLTANAVLDSPEVSGVITIDFLLLVLEPDSELSAP